MEDWSSCTSCGSSFRRASRSRRHSLTDDTLIDHIESLIRTENFPADRLILEVTETVAIANISAGRTSAEPSFSYPKPSRSTS